MFEICARVAGGGYDRDVVCCFAPTLVVLRLKEVFPNVEIDPRDYAWKDFDSFKQRSALQGYSSGIEGCIRIAEGDARRRGPIWAFSLKLPTGATIRGSAERYRVGIRSDEPIPEPLRSEFINFLNTLKFAPCVTVKSVRLEGNSEYPA